MEFGSVDDVIDFGISDEKGAVDFDLTLAG